MDDGDQIVIAQHSAVRPSVDRVQRNLWRPQIDQIRGRAKVDTTTNTVVSADFQLKDHQNTVRELTTSGALVSAGIRLPSL